MRNSLRKKRKGWALIKRPLMHIVLFLFSLVASNAAMPGKILPGLYTSSRSNNVIKIENGNYTISGDQIEIHLDKNRMLRYTVFSWTSFGDAHELYCLSDFENKNNLRNETKLRRWKK